MYWTDDPLFCPVRAWAGIVQSILLDPQGSTSSPVNFCRHSVPNSTGTTPNSRVSFLKAAGMISLIRRAASSIGEAQLGFPIDELGTHSIRSGAAMAMHLDQVPRYEIMIIGRWASDAFMRYLRVQIMQFAQHVSSRNNPPGFLLSPRLRP